MQDVEKEEWAFPRTPWYMCVCVCVLKRLFINYWGMLDFKVAESLVNKSWTYFGVWIYMCTCMMVKSIMHARLMGIKIILGTILFLCVAALMYWIRGFLLFWLYIFSWWCYVVEIFPCDCACDFPFSIGFSHLHFNFFLLNVMLGARGNLLGMVGKTHSYGKRAESNPREDMSWERHRHYVNEKGREGEVCD